MADQNELVDVEVRFDSETAYVIDSYAAQCGLTRDQMASALFVLAFRRLTDSAPVKDGA